VLTLIDDDTTSNRVKGCSLLVSLLSKTPTTLLQRTGLGPVFEEALMPCLLQLPPLTALGECESLLNAVYPALISLEQCRFPSPGMAREKQKSLDRILRVGVLKGISHVSECVEIHRLLLARMGDLVDEMGVQSVKHLKVSNRVL